MPPFLRKLRDQPKVILAIFNFTTEPIKRGGPALDLSWTVLPPYIFYFYREIRLISNFVSMVLSFSSPGRREGEDYVNRLYYKLWLDMAFSGETPSFSIYTPNAVITLSLGREGWFLSL